MWFSILECRGAHLQETYANKRPPMHEFTAMWSSKRRLIIRHLHQLRANAADQWIPQTLLVVCAFEGCRSYRPLFSLLLARDHAESQTVRIWAKKKKKRKKVAWAVFYKFFLVTSTVPLPKRNQPAGPVGPAPFGTDSVWLSFLQGYEFSRVLWAPFCSLLKGRRENFMLPHTPRKDAERSCSTCYY